MKRFLSLILSACVLISCFSGALLTVKAQNTIMHEFWVDPENGSDDNDGTESQPFATIQKAKEETSALTPNMTGDIIVYLHSGTYNITSPIVFGEEDSGNGDYNVIYKAVGGETPVINGGTNISGWTLYDEEKNIFVADVPEGAVESRQFYVNGQRQVRAKSETSPTDWKIFGSEGYKSPSVETQDAHEYVIIDLGEEQPVSLISLYTGDLMDKDEKAAGFPKDFTLQLSADGENYTTVVAETDFAAPELNSKVDFSFPSQNARYVKLDVTKLGTPDRLNPNKYLLALSEIEVSASALSTSVNLDTAQHTDYTTNIIEGLSEENIALSHNETAVIFPLDRLTDGTTDSGFITTVMAAKSDFDNGLAFTLDVKLDSCQSISEIKLWAREDSPGNFLNEPTKIELQITQDDSENWKTIKTFDNIEWTAGQPAKLSFAPVAAKKVRLRICDIGHGEAYDEATGMSYCRFQLTEMELYKPADLAKGKEVTAPNSWEYPDWNLSKDVIVTGVVDATYNGFYTSQPVSSPDAIDAPVTIDLGETQELGGVRLYPRSLDGTTNVNYPKDLIISTSQDGVNFTTALELHDVPDTGTKAQTFVFDSKVNARYVRVEPKSIRYGEAEGNYRFQLVALEVMPAASDKENTIPDDLVTQEGATLEQPNYSFGKNVIALHDNSNHSQNANRLTDGVMYSSVDKMGYIVPEKYQLNNYQNISDLEIHVLRWWYHLIAKASTMSENGQELIFDQKQVSPVNITTDRPTWIENAYELIDQAGEWYIDREESKIYYKAESNMDGITATLPVAEQLIKFQNAQNIVLDGITFEYTKWSDPNVYGYADAQSGSYAIDNSGVWKEVNGGIELNMSNNITLQNNVLRNFGAGGIRIWNGSCDNLVYGNAIHDISSGGIWVGSIHGHGTPCTDPVIKNNVIRNNYITRIGVDYFDASGITVLYTEGTVIDHNEISYTSYTGVSLGWGWNYAVAECAKNNTISNNYIHNVGKTQHDGGAIYTLGSQPGTKIYGNYVHDYSDGLYDKDAGLYLDEGSTNIEVYNNVVGANTYWWMKMWTTSIKNNYWHDNYHQTDKGWNDGTDNVVENNTLVADGNFDAIPEAKAIIDNAGLIDEQVKIGITEGISSNHDIQLTMYPDSPAYYYTLTKGFNTFTIENQIGETKFDIIERVIEILMPEGTDLTSLAPEFSLEDGFTSTISSGSVQDFSDCVDYVLTSEDETITWTVKVTESTSATGEITGTVETLDDAINDLTGWTGLPEKNEDGSITIPVGKFIGYTNQRFSNDTILQFDMMSPLNLNTKDWLGFSLRDQDPFTMLTTMYYIGFNYDSVEVQKWVNGERTMLYGTIPDYIPVFGDLPNDFYTPNTRHSIKAGAIDVEQGVRIFLYIDGNKIFDIVDNNDPIKNDGFFTAYAMTQPITLLNFTDIQNVQPTTFTTTFVIDDEQIEVVTNVGETIKMPETPQKPNYIFKGWYTAPTGGSEVTEFTSTQTVYAQWNAVEENPETTFTTTFVIDDEEIEVVTKVGEAIKMPETPQKPNYTFKGWYTAPTGGSEVTEFTSTQTVHAQWTAVEKEPDEQNPNEQDPGEESPDEPNPEDVPETGDYNHILVWSALFFLSCGILVAFSITNKCKS